MRVRHLLAVLTLVLAACGHTSAAPTSVPFVGVADYASPVQRVLYGSPEQWKAKVADEGREISACMAGRGWPGFPPTMSLVVLPMTVQEHYQFGLQFGYGVSTQLDQDRHPTAPADDPMTPFFATLTDAQRASVSQALWADATGVTPGCVYVGHRAAFGNLDLIKPAYDQMTQAINAAIKADPDLVTANHEWSVCMVGKGYHFDDPDHISGSLQDELNRKEAAVYAADQSCDKQVKRTIRYLAAQDRAENSALADPSFAGFDAPPTSG